MGGTAVNEEYLQGLICEYRSYVENSQAEGEFVGQARLIRDLEDSGGWTTQAAEELITLARGYGVFFLRNALAIAKALQIEDGEAGF